MFDVRCWIFTLLLLTIGSYSITAQSLQEIYSGLDKATSLSVTQNAIYIVEQGKNRLVKLDHSGKVLEIIGGKGSGDYQFSKPIDVDATNGLKIFITDYNNRRVQVFDRRGQYLSSISGRKNFGNSRRYEPTQIAVNNLGEVFFVDETANYIYRFDLDSNLLDEFRIPSDIREISELIVNGQRILILDLKTQTIHELALNGSYQRFYPAKGVLAIYADEESIYKAFSDSVEIEDKNREIDKLMFDQVVQPVDIQVSDGIIYILSAGSLFKITSY